MEEHRSIHDCYFLSLFVGMHQITWQDFTNIELRVGTIIDVQDFPEAIKPAYKITVNFGESFGIKKSSAQITSYPKEELLHKKIIGVVNFPLKQIGKFISEFLVTGFVQEYGAVVLAIPDKKSTNGIQLS